RLYQQTLELSFTDPLTGVPNRRQLFLRLENELSRSLRFGEPVSLLMIDLDHFKRINDEHGHTVGDGVLRGVALALRRSIRKIDVVARYGGEEFCVVLPRVAKPEAFEVAEKLRRAVAATTVPGPEGHPPLSVTISVGVATLQQYLSRVVRKDWGGARRLTHARTLAVIAHMRRRTGVERHNLAPWANRDAELKTFRFTGARQVSPGAVLIQVGEDSYRAAE